MADESEGYYAYGFKYAWPDYDGALEFAAGLSGYAERLRNYGEDDYDHTDQGEATCFCELQRVSLEKLR